VLVLASALLVSALVVAASVLWAAGHVAAATRRADGDEPRARAAQLLAVFAPAVGAVEQDVQTLLVWEPLARTARSLFPDAFALLDSAAGQVFPFSKERVQAAHATWTANWLSWERSHDTEYKLKAAAAEHELAASGGSALARARIDAVEREKLDLYQRRYESYIKVAKALQALAGTSAH
jgi:hypothetical protein